MVNTAESKQDQSRHFGLKLKARRSTAQIGKGPKRGVSKKPVLVQSGHISRKDQFYGFHTPWNTQLRHSVKKDKSSSEIVEESKVIQKKHKSFTVEQAMHPEQIQMAGVVNNSVEEKHLKSQDAVEDEIDVEEVGDLNGGAKDELNGNGYLHKENGHSHQVEVDKQEIVVEEKMPADSNTVNGAEVKPVTRIRGSRRNSTSSRSSSVSSVPSVKQQAPMALQMEVSMDDEDKDQMEPLIIEGTAEDLEVSMSAHDEYDDDEDDDDDGDGDDGTTTDSEAVAEPPHDPYEFEDEINDDTEMLSKKLKPSKSGKGVKALKSQSKTKLESKSVKPRTPRTKSLKLKGSKASPKVSEKVFEEIDTENSDTNSLSKYDTESEDLNFKPSKTPSKRVKSTPSKQDRHEGAEVYEKSGDTEHGPRRSSRSRQTPQKYNSSIYADSVWEHQLLGDDRMNSSDAVHGTTGIRSVKGRRSLRKSRNISALNSSLHNESSPWDNEYKVLTPSGGGISAHDASVADKVESSTPLKRKAIDEDDDDINERGQKKMCVENTDLDTSTSSRTSSFFSVITSPIVMLRNKLRGPSVSSSTPIADNIATPTVDPDSKNPSDMEIENGSDTVISVQGEPGTPAPLLVETSAVEQAQEARSWCAIM